MLRCGGRFESRNTRALVSRPGNGAASLEKVTTASNRNRSLSRLHKRVEERPSQTSAGSRKANRPPGERDSRPFKRK